MARRTTQQIIDSADELAQQFEDYEPKPGDQRDPLFMARLHAAVVSRTEVEKTLLEAVCDARRNSYSWAAIGVELGTTGEAARQKYARLTEDA